MDAQVGRDTTACAPTVAPATGTELPCNPLCSRTGTVPGGLGALSASMALRSSSSSLMVDEARRTPPRFLKAATESESSRVEFGILENDRCIDTGVFQRRYLLVFACSPPPPPRLQIRHTFLTQADWCAVRAVARCELGLFPVISDDRGVVIPGCFGTDRSLGRSA